MQANFRCSPPPIRLTPLTARVIQHDLHLRELHITHSVGNERQIYSSLQRGASPYWLLTASIFFDSAHHRTSPSRLCVFHPDISCFTLVHHVLRDDQLRLLLQVTAHVLQPKITCAVARKATARYGWASARRFPPQDMRCCCTSAHLGDGPSSTTYERRLSPFFLDTQTS